MSDRSTQENPSEGDLRVVKITRLRLRDALQNTGTLIQMIVNDVDPSDIEDAVTEILEYLEKTREAER